MDRHVSSETECLLLDAKKAILQEQHRRFQKLQQQGRWEEAMQQLHTTLSCAADLLKDSVTILERVVIRSQSKPQKPFPDSPPQPDQYYRET